ncbi:hypothetical protein HanRHA438_Chr05g0210821 [Helianthus annuus]|nr:hypothetical protein HanRHA438_Chr05g0210821 [Helianthus annuus]
MILKPNQIFGLVTLTSSGARFTSTTTNLQFQSRTVSAKMANPAVSDSEKKLITHVIFDMDGLLLGSYSHNLHFLTLSLTAATQLLTKTVIYIQIY